MSAGSYSLDSLKRKSQKLTAAFNSLPGVSCQPAQGAMYCFPNIVFPEGAIAEAKKFNREVDEFYALEMLNATGVVHHHHTILPHNSSALFLAVDSVKNLAPITFEQRFCRQKMTLTILFLPSQIFMWSSCSATNKPTSHLSKNQGWAIGACYSIFVSFLHPPNSECIDLLLTEEARTESRWFDQVAKCAGDVYRAASDNVHTKFTQTKFVATKLTKSISITKNPPMNGLRLDKGDNILTGRLESGVRTQHCATSQNAFPTLFRVRFISAITLGASSTSGKKLLLTNGKCRLSFRTNWAFAL